jgi:hypothetical protein
MADLAEIKERVVSATTAAAAKVGIADIILEVDRDEDGDDFLRVIIEVKHGERAKDADYEAWLEAIEKAVGEIDDRYPSVRFSDAA